MAAGFPDPEISHVELVWQLPSSDALFDIMVNSSVRNAALLRAQRRDILDAIRVQARGSGCTSKRSADARCAVVGSKTVTQKPVKNRRTTKLIGSAGR
jgi:hypothetical protein